MTSINAYVSWPAAPLTERLVRRALGRIPLTTNFVSKDQLTGAVPLLQWSTYDNIDHEQAHFHRTDVLSSSYTFRKALIRKHYLSRTITSYLAKNPDSILAAHVPKTFEIELTFADELDEMWTDELWDVGKLIDQGDHWWIMKPGMSDRGMGIRLFHTKGELQQIFDSFEEEQEDEDEKEQDEEAADGTAVVISQLRHFVIQDYIRNPLLLDPREKSKGSTDLAGHKFHLRVYAVLNADVQVYITPKILALFSAEKYIDPSEQALDNSQDRDLRPHLTNTSLQTDFGEENVRLLEELEGYKILSGNGTRSLKVEDIQFLTAEVGKVTAEVINAALPNPVHFQPVPNAFELFGIDFVVSHEPDGQLSVKLLEINAEPAIELTGPRLTWILEDLFESIAKVCVVPFFDGSSTEQEWAVGQVRHNLLKCSDVKTRA